MKVSIKKFVQGKEVPNGMTKKEALKVASVRATLDLCEGKIMKVTFVKKGGELSTMTCRTDASVGLKGGKSTANKKGGQITVYKMAGVNSSYRSFYGQNVIKIECGKQLAVFE